MKKADKYADEAEINKFIRLNIITTAIVAITYGIVVFLCAYLAQDAMQALVKSMPVWLTHGFGIAGGILPAVGFGMLLKVMLKGEFIPFLIIGFVVASFLPFSNLLPVAVIGLALALIIFNIDKDKAKMLASINNSKGDDFSDGI